MYETLYEKNKGLLEYMAQRYARACALDRAVSREDLVQAGFFGLVEAAKSFDASRGKSWPAWAVWHIRAEIERTLGMSRGQIVKAHVGADTLDRRLPGEEDTALDRLADESLPDADAGLLLDELRQGVRDAVDRLKSDRQRQLTRLCRLEGRDYPQAARDMGISVPYARRLWAQASFHLARDRKLQFLAGLDARTRFHAHKGVAAFNRDWTSVTEGAALWRVEQERRRGI